MMRRGIGRVGRPSLVGTMARTAVVAGTATAVAGGMSRHSQAKQQQAAEAQAYEQQQQQAQIDAQVAAAVAAQAPPPPPPAAAPRRRWRRRRPAHQARRAEGPGHPHRRRVRRRKGENSRRLIANLGGQRVISESGRLTADFLMPWPPRSMTTRVIDGPSPDRRLQLASRREPLGATAVVRSPRWRCVAGNRHRRRWGAARRRHRRPERSDPADRPRAAVHERAAARSPDGCAAVDIPHGDRRRPVGAGRSPIALVGVVWLTINAVVDQWPEIKLLIEERPDHAVRMSRRTPALLINAAATLEHGASDAVGEVVNLLFHGAIQLAPTVAALDRRHHPQPARDVLLPQGRPVDVALDRGVASTLRTASSTESASGCGRWSRGTCSGRPRSPRSTPR